MAKKRVKNIFGIISLFSLVSCLVFLSAGITGNVIAGLSREKLNILSLIFFIVALFGSIIYSKVKDKG